ncbi:hypothetical protein [Limnohabitans sp.]|jgi:hypothetical protein|uniref:hypothetical protein n=1 Tax=Limnohabitans sp. TaxID=1907725 RepID=UPI0037BFFECB
MTIGFVFECGPQGADKLVCEYLASQLKPGENFISRTLDNKLRLLEEAPSVVKKLLTEGCDRVLIVWDLRPAWPDKKDKPCRAKERQTLLDGLANEGLQGAPVFLVCVEQELESWLLASDHAISAFLSTDAHPYQADRVRKPDRVRNPKAVMNNHFKAARGARYEDYVHAVKVLKAAAVDWRRLRRSESFARFEAKL